METRANHLLIGGCVILLVAAAFGFIVWLAKLRIDKEVALYEIHFTDAVSGLGVGSDVRFNGIKVGAVERININADDPNKVNVIVKIDADTPVRADSAAALELQGVTGQSFVQISGGSRAAAMVPPKQRPPLPVIASKPSSISELFRGAPDLVNRGIVLIERAADLVNDENRKNLSRIVADLRTLSGVVAGKDVAIGQTIDSMASVAKKFDRIAGQAESTLNNADAAAVALTQLVNELHDIVAASRQPVESFTAEGLADLKRLIQDTRILVGSIARVAARLEDDPSQVLFGSRDAEFRPEGR
jgi:phospholipid/cholesterol/gamma-HCH transport system substrate-binding protein